MKHVFIVNPVSGGGSALKEAQKIDKFAKKENYCKYFFEL